MNEWSDSSLGEVLPLKYGKNLPESKRISGEVPVYSSAGHTGFHDTALVSEPSIVVGRKGSVGTVYYEDRSCFPIDTAFYTTGSDKIDLRFGYYALVNANLSQHSQDSAVPGLNRDIYSRIRVSLPPLGEQQAIAEVLGALDDKIAANTKLATTADQFLASVFARVTAGTSTLRLGDVATVNPESCKPVDRGSLRYIDISSVGQGTFEFPEISSWDEAPSRARRHVQRGDVLWSTVRPNRRSHALNLSNDPLLVGSTGLAILRPQEVGFAYLYEATKTPDFTAYLENVAEGSAYPAVRANRFDEAPINWAPAAERESFEMMAAPLRETLHSLDSENLHLASVRDALLPQLMSGKLRVKEAKDLVAAAI